MASENVRREDVTEASCCVALRRVVEGVKRRRLQGRGDLWQGRVSAACRRVVEPLVVVLQAEQRRIQVAAERSTFIHSRWTKLVDLRLWR